MAKKEKLITGVDIGSHAVKVCQLERAGDSYRLVALGCGALPPGAVEDGTLQDPEEVGRVVRALFNNLKIKSNKVGISISGYSVIVKKIQLEVMDEEELAEYIMSEAEQYIPFDIEDVYLDFQDLRTASEENERTDVMLVAAKKEVIDDYLTMLQEQKLQPMLVDVDGFALENIWHIASASEENVALVDIGAAKMNINIIADGASVLARDIAVGSEQLTDQIAHALGIDYDEAEKIKLGLVPAGDREREISDIFTQTCTQWVLEIKKAIDLYLSNNPDKPLSRLVLSGGGSKVSGLKKFIGRETGLETVQFNPFANMKVNKKKIDQEYLDKVAPEMAIAAGLAIRPAQF
ncbi:pilus assembly protein PilM [Desulfolithobacter dissulfuricans]|uniref:Pilus assembly protein PilM n=1 Tax=Desulfolithobacter dissulfuricans TaxID=2795293 RepID=A0A915XLR8_9BACT|nr:type IV pilus assembly protein PilM [Desulfolithobacter dissulfuricans]BCO10346.1 pilus assembly protein PilM [Desulfolithobacter dissulfuricans]